MGSKDPLDPIKNKKFLVILETRGVQEVGANAQCKKKHIINSQTKMLIRFIL